MDEKIEYTFANIFTCLDSLICCNISVKLSIKLLIKCNFVYIFNCVQNTCDAVTNATSKI